MYFWEKEQYAELIDIEDICKLTDKVQLIEPLIKSSSTFYHLQVNLFAELVERLLEEGKLSLNNPEEFHKLYPNKVKTTVARLAGLESLRNFLRK